MALILLRIIVTKKLVYPPVGSFPCTVLLLDALTNQATTAGSTCEKLYFVICVRLLHTEIKQSNPFRE